MTKTPKIILYLIHTWQNTGNYGGGEVNERFLVLPEMI